MKCEMVCGVPIATGTREEIINASHNLVGQGGVVCTPNAEIMSIARREAAYKRLLISSALNVPDGISVVRALASMGFYTEKVSGVELGEALLSFGHSFAIIGGKEGVAERAGRTLSAEYPSSEFKFSRSGFGYRVSDIRKQLARHAPEIVFVCLGAPKQEYLISEIMSASPTSLYLALGGAVDVYAGDKARAPECFRMTGLEWLWRIAAEPKRIKKLPLVMRFALLPRNKYSEEC